MYHCTVRVLRSAACATQNCARTANLFSTSRQLPEAKFHVWRAIRAFPGGSRAAPAPGVTAESITLALAWARLTLAPLIRRPAPIPVEISAENAACLCRDRLAFRGRS